MAIRTKRNFDCLVDAYLNFVSTHEGTPRVHKWSIISVIAGALERRVWMDRGFYTLYPNLYTFIIGRSGLIKKTTSTGIAIALLRELDGFKIMAERMSAASLIEQLKMSGRTFDYDGRAIKQSPLYAYASELSVFLSEVWGNLTELLTTFYDCLPHDSSKPWFSSTISRGDTKIFGPCLNMLGCSTHAWLKKCIPKSEIEGGFTSRIIFVVENNIPENLVAWPEVDRQRDLMRMKIVSDLKDIYNLVGQVSVEPEAKDMFTKWYSHHMKYIMPVNQDPRMCGYMARKGDTILKLAIISSVSRRNNLKIMKEDIIWASDQMDELEADWRQAFDGVGTEDNNLNYKIRQFVRSRVKVPKQELLNIYNRQYPSSEVMKAISELIDTNEIEDYTEKTFGSHPIGFYTTPGINNINS